MWVKLIIYFPNFFLFFLFFSSFIVVFISMYLDSVQNYTFYPTLTPNP